MKLFCCAASSVFLCFVFSSVLSNGENHVSVRGGSDSKASWVEVHANTEEDAPSPVRGEFTTNSWNDKIIVYGGCDIRFVNWMNDTWVFPIQRGVDKGGAYKLETKGSAPPGTCGHGAAVVEDRLYVYGGNGVDGPSDLLHYLDLKTNEWNEVQKQSSAVWPPSRALIQHAMMPSTEANEFIIVSGTSSEKDSDGGAYVFSLKDSKWRKISNSFSNQQDVGGSAAVVYGERLYVMGGYANGGVLSDFSSVSIDNKNGTFEPVKAQGTSSPGALAFQGLLVMDKYMILYGGFSMEGINGDVWVWDLENTKQDQWCKLETTGSKPLPHFAGGWVSVGDSLYAFGGRVNPTGKREQLTSDLWRLDNVQATIASSCTF